MVDGFIVVDKPAGMTSHDVVNMLRRIAGLRKVGHTGTLDPFATGVLPVALGEGTKAIPFLDESVKEYRAVMRLGESTDTQDCTGRVIRSGDWSVITPVAIDAAVKAFTGRGEQIPPMYSALKRGGIPLYKLARKGEEVIREPRQIEIHGLDIEHIALPDVSFTVRCSRGVYVRTLASDIGDRLGCGAHLTELRRTASGPFALHSSFSLTELASAGSDGRLREHVISCCSALAHMRAITLTDSGVVKVGRGIAPGMNDMQEFAEELRPGERVRLCRGETLLAVAEQGVGNLNLRLLRVFNEH